ncbi:MAG: YcfL family protein [Chlorobium sp.]|nr:YcfL family protein [Chlorobium phaeovibrioides]NQU45870.1 YcfL family protein [Chlorobium sp.]
MIKKSPLLVLLLFLFLGGCGSSKLHDRRASIIDGSIRGKIVLLELSSLISSEGLMSVQVTGKNTTDKYRLLEYRMEWFDMDGMLVPTVMTRWVKFPAFEKSNFSFKTVAPRVPVKDFRVIIRKAQ